MSCYSMWYIITQKGLYCVHIKKKRKENMTSCDFLWESIWWSLHVAILPDNDLEVKALQFAVFKLEH